MRFTMGAQPFLTRIVIKNYKSIAGCDVRLRPLTFLVGPNGSGKSNLLDALHFVTDSLRTTLDHALRDRGGIGEVRRRSAGHPTHFGVRVEFSLDDGKFGHYSFRIGAQPQGGHEVQQEECYVHGPEAFSKSFFEVESGCVVSSVAVVPAASTDRLYLVALSGQEPFRSVFFALSQMGFYNLNPDRIRDLQSPDTGELLSRDGSNITSVLSRIEKDDGSSKQRIEEYLSKVVPGVAAVDVRVIGPKETLEFKQDTAGSKAPWRFLAASMSDGTLRALGILVSLFQSGNGRRVPLVGIEEPEAGLHPGAAGVLFDSLREASRTKQIVVTSHSPDMLDHESLDADSILAFEAKLGSTHVAPADAAGLSVLHDRLYTAGDLLRMNQLRPDPKSVSAGQLNLFGKTVAS